MGNGAVRLDGVPIEDLVQDAAVRGVPVAGPVVIHLDIEHVPNRLGVQDSIELVRLDQGSVQVEDNQAHGLLLGLAMAKAPASAFATLV